MNLESMDGLEFTEWDVDQPSMGAVGTMLRKVALLHAGMSPSANPLRNPCREPAGPQQPWWHALAAKPGALTHHAYSVAISTERRLYR